MNVVDSSAWIEYFTGDSNAEFFAPIIENQKELIVPSICLYEVFRLIYRRVGKLEALEKTAVMRKGFVADLTTALSLQAASLSIQKQLSMADCIILATAQAYRAKLWTQDSDFEGLPDVKFRRKK